MVVGCVLVMMWCSVVVWSVLVGWHGGVVHHSGVVVWGMVWYGMAV